MNNRSGGGFSKLQNIKNEMEKKLINDYYTELKKGYFTHNGVLKIDYIMLYPEIIADYLGGDGNKLTNTQLRNFYDYVRVAESTYKYSKDAGNTTETIKENLIIKIKKLNGMVTYSLGRDNSTVSKEFRQFLLANVEACNTVEDVLNGFIPHFEAVVGYFKYKNPRSK
jgi:CRISPR-associated protein Csm2